MGNLARTIASRFLRLWFLMLVPALWGLLRSDPGLLDKDGSLHKVRLASWLLMFGNYLPYEEVGQWFVNFSLSPCWYLVTEFQCSVLLIILVPFIFKSYGHAVWPYIFLIVVFANFNAV